MSQLNKFPLMFAAEDAPSGGGTSDAAPMNVEDVIEFLEDDDDDTIPIDEGKDKKDEPKKPVKAASHKEADSDRDEEDNEEDGKNNADDSDDDELSDIERELEGPSEEQLELMTPARRRDILKKYPTLFKDFPYLEKAYYREQQFTELLPTIEDAKMAVEKARILDQFESQVMGGNIETILKAVKAESPEAFYRAADDYLGTLARVDEKAYFHVLSTIGKSTIMAMVNEANRSNNDVLRSAAQILNQFLFASSEFTPATKLAGEKPKDNGQNQEVDQRQRQFVQQAFNSTRDDLNTRVNNTLRNTVDVNIDPKGTMNDYTKRNASRDAMEQLEGLIVQDSRFRILSDRLWERAFQSNFAKADVDKIKTAYLSKAKTLLPTVLKKARQEALKGMGKRVSGEDNTDRRGPIAPSKPRSSSSGKVTKASDIPKGMKTIDFLNAD